MQTLDLWTVPSAQTAEVSVSDPWVAAVAHTTEAETEEVIEEVATNSVKILLVISTERIETGIVADPIGRWASIGSTEEEEAGGWRGTARVILRHLLQSLHG